MDAQEVKRRWQQACGTKVTSRKTLSGLSVEPLYLPSEQAEAYEQKLGVPGEYPFTRGVYPTMYLERPWTMRQYSGFGTAEDTNARYKRLLAEGQTGLSVAFDLPTQLGLDSDMEEAEIEVGRVGVAVDSLADFEVLFDGIPLDKISTSFTINATAPVILAMYMLVAEKQGVPLARVSGTTQNDILKEFVARGTWIFPVEPSLRLVADTVTFSAEHFPRFNPISIAGAHFRDAGATAVQEAAFTLSDGIIYVDRVLRREMPVDQFGPRLSFYFYTYADIFEEVAKYRAMRRLWARMMKERFGARDPRSMMFRFGVVCGGKSLTRQQPLNNVVRVAYEALAAVLGGVQSVFTAAYDEAYALPTEESAILALRTQQILAHEAGVTHTIDPLAGSYYVESLTDQMEEAILSTMDEVERLGGMVRCVENGTIQRMIADEAYRAERAIAAGEQVVVGVNRYQSQEEGEVHLHEYDPSILDRQRERLHEVRRRRDHATVQRALHDLRAACQDAGKNLMPYIVEAVQAYATIGEITNTMKDVFGVFQEPIVI
ncbi:MAG: methylmalonyl-CoA mutase [Deltaproteobacteria bacterium]|nr:methylmalonyl-CoA mutase [Deltaproteobacteria bacterium]